MSKAVMHCHDELERDLNMGRNFNAFLSNQMMVAWFEEGYSTSKHLLTLYSIVRGLNAQNVLEIGFGRSSFVLMKAIKETGGHLICCDKKGVGNNEGFQYLLSEAEREVVTYLHGKSNLAWDYLDKREHGLDFAFLDYFGDKNISESFVCKELQNCLSYLKQNGIIVVHDVYNEYKVTGVVDTIDWADVEYVSLPYCYGLGIFRKVQTSQYGKVEDQFPKKEDTYVGE